MSEQRRQLLLTKEEAIILESLLADEEDHLVEAPAPWPELDIVASLWERIRALVYDDHVWPAGDRQLECRIDGRPERLVAA